MILSPRDDHVIVRIRRLHLGWWSCWPVEFDPVYYSRNPWLAYVHSWVLLFDGQRIAYNAK